MLTVIKITDCMNVNIDFYHCTFYVNVDCYQNNWLGECEYWLLSK